MASPVAAMARPLRGLPSLLAVPLAVAICASAAAQEIVATIPVGDAPGRPGLDLEQNRIYVPNLADDTVSVIDGETLAVTDTLPPPGAAYSFATPVTVAVAHAAGKIYVANADTDDVTVLDRATWAHIGTVAVGDNPADVAVNEAAGKVYVANQSSGDVTVIDAVTDAVRTTVVMDVDARPRELEVDETTGTVYVACGKNLAAGLQSFDSIQEVAGDVYTGRKIELIQPRDVQIDPATRTLYTLSELAVGDVQLRAFDATTMSFVGSSTYGVGGSATNFEIDPETGHFFLPQLNDQYVTVFELPSKRRTSLPTAANASPLRIAYDPVRKRAYAANRGGDTVSVVDDRRFSPEYSKCWKAKDAKAPKFEKIADPGLSLHDDFSDDEDVAVVKPFLICNPASVEGGPVRDPDAHQCCYKIRGKKLDPKPRFQVEDRFGSFVWQGVGAPQTLCVPCDVTPLP